MELGTAVRETKSSGRAQSVFSKGIISFSLAFAHAFSPPFPPRETLFPSTQTEPPSFLLPPQARALLGSRVQPGGFWGSRMQAGHWQNTEKPLTASCSFLLSQVTHPSSSPYLMWHSITPKGPQTPPAPISCQSLCTLPELPALQPCKDCINI